MNELDSAGRYDEILETIRRKAALRYFYTEMYRKFADCLRKVPVGGLALELGSGGGFIKEIIPEMVTSDMIPYAGVDRKVDGTRMELPDNSLRVICMQNVFHHIPDVEAFFYEARRCLKPGGRIYIIDPYLGWLSTFIYKYIHYEPLSMDAKEWKFESSGPLSDANSAMSWLVFERDLNKFKALYPEFSIVRYEPHSPLRYWLAGGLKSWSLLPSWAFGFATTIDRLLVRVCPRLASFVDIEIVKAF